MIAGKTAAIPVIIAATLFSCALFYTPLRITGWSPGAGLPVDPETAVISIIFNHEPDIIITEDAFSISCDGEDLPGRINWQEKVMIFTPYIKLRENSEYIIKIDSSAEDQNGNSLTEDFIVSFRTGDEDARPAVRSVTPADDSFINNRFTDIVISFDRAMDFSSLLSGFSITPEIKGISTMDSTNTIFRFTPVAALELQEKYTVGLSVKTTSLNGYSLADEYQFSFTISSDNTPPEIVEASSEDSLIVLSDSNVNTGWDKDTALRLHFSEDIDRESAEASITIEPPTPFDISFDELTTPVDLIISFTENLQWQLLYSLSISTALKDLSGNMIELERKYKLFVDGTSSAPPRLVRADFVPEATAVCFFDALTPASAIDSHQILDTSGGDADQNPFYFDFYFTLAEGSTLPFFEFTENFLISPSNSCLTINYLDFQLFNPGASTVSAAAPQPTPSAEQAVLRLITAVNDSQTLSGNIIFRVYSDLTDSLGNSMQVDWSRELFDEDN